jgi:hypothetical protein
MGLATILSNFYLKPTPGRELRSRLPVTRWTSRVGGLMMRSNQPSTVSINPWLSWTAIVVVKLRNHFSCSRPKAGCLQSSADGLRELQRFALALPSEHSSEDTRAEDHLSRLALLRVENVRSEVLIV